MTLCRLRMLQGFQELAAQDAVGAADFAGVDLAVLEPATHRGSSES